MFAGCALMVFVNGLVQIILPACVILSGMETSVINIKQPQSSLNVIIIIHKKTNTQHRSIDMVSLFACMQ